MSVPNLHALLKNDGSLLTGRFAIIEFDGTSVTNLASPVFRNNPGFVGMGRTLGGAREFSIPNNLLSDLDDVTIRIVE